ncbi:hypothetical protein EXE46_15785 [Halorubrum sp. GN11_10-6_MGM]|uniref:right-handed parallel beta-helix repeat-containing protein n=1 Tax=Halorubrum sp. GN11_10-6_MGM TaxID=2518112 RepID=UPI0010F9EDBC|nr:right-handed parallel beta-helix repeat-containing protein [Halorubrum sp. GN11_10-6_MGM]TKX72479.1 hypothetical protein EXE46_15785 [Halorubrum sp. GN11_10-6_MGM]
MAADGERLASIDNSVQNATDLQNVTSFNIDNTDGIGGSPPELYQAIKIELEDGTLSSGDRISVVYSGSATSDATDSEWNVFVIADDGSINSTISASSDLTTAIDDVYGQVEQDNITSISFDAGVGMTDGDTFGVYDGTNHTVSELSVNGNFLLHERVENVDQGTFHPDIQSAIKGAGTDETIEVADGTYEEKIKASVGGLTLKAATGATPVINVSDAERQDGDDVRRAVEVYEDNVTIDGFEIDGFMLYGVAVDAKNVNIVNNTIPNGQKDYNGESWAIDIRNSKNVLVEGNNLDVWANRSVYIHKSSNNININDNNITAENETLAEGLSAIGVEGSSDVTLKNNIIEGFGEAVEITPFFASSDDITISQNRIKDNNVGVKVGYGGDLSHVLC